MTYHSNAPEAEPNGGETVAEDKSCRFVSPLRGTLVVLLPFLVFLAALYCYTAFRMPAGIDLAASPGNAFFDMDTTRVIGDWTSMSQSDRSRTHPLYKFVALPGIALNRLVFGGENPTAVARLLCIAGILGQCLLTGILAWQLCGRTRWAALVGVMLSGLSFPAFLLASIPDTAALSGMFSVLPYIYLYARRGRPITWREIAVWIALAIGAYGITITQVVFVFLAFFYRLHWLHPIRPAAPPVPQARFHAGWWAAMFLPLGLSVYLLLQLHGAVFGGGNRHYKIVRIMEKEFKYVETDQMTASPVQRVWLLGRQWLLYDFASPTPMISRWNHPRDDRQFISITHMETDYRHWHWWYMPFVFSQFILLLLLACFARWRSELMPLALGLAFQFLLHFAYGRDFVIYALNWHSLVVVFALALLPWGRPVAVGILVGLHALVMGATNLNSLSNVFDIYRNDFPVEEARAIIEPPD